MPRRGWEPPDEDDDAHRLAQQKNAQAWNALRRFGQPVCVALAVGRTVMGIHNHFAGSENILIEPALTWPLVGLAIASCVNSAEDDPRQSIRNYVYYGMIGLLASAATITSNGTQFFFEQLNEGWLKNVFTGTFLHPQDGSWILHDGCLPHSLSILAKGYL